MSQTPQPKFAQPMQPYSQSPPQENGFGLAGFIVSIAALFLCGIPSIVGVLLSLIGLRKQPQGFAIAGLILGLVGLVEIIGVGFLAFSAYQVGQQVAKSAGSLLQEFPVMIQLNQEAETIGNEWERLSHVPTQAEGDELLKGKRDTMGNQLVYETDGTSFSLRTAGADGTLDTDDDITAGPFLDLESTRQLAVEGEVEWDEDFEGSGIKEMIEAELKKNAGNDVE